MGVRVILIGSGDVLAEAALERLAGQGSPVDVLACDRLADALELAPSFGPMLICVAERRLDEAAARLLPALLGRHPRAMLVMLRQAADLALLQGMVEAMAASVPTGRGEAGYGAVMQREAGAGRGDAGRGDAGRGNAGRGDAGPRLTEREMEVVLLLREGLQNKLIARRLDLSVSTVKTHVANIFRKIGAGNRLDAICKFADLHRVAEPDPLLVFREHMLAQREAAMFRPAVA